MTTSVRQSTRTGDARWLIGVAVTLALASLPPGAALAQGNSQNISGNVSVDFSHAYFFRGIAQETDGLVTQPAADIAWSLFEAPDASGLQGVSYYLGLWNSLHTGPTGSGTSGNATHVRSWYESDFFTGVALDIDNWEAGITYTSYMSPNASFNSVSEMAFSLAMDDEAYFGRLAMNPHVVLAVELDGQRDAGESEGVYLEIGVEPGLPVMNGRAAITFPVTFGFSMSNYYENGDALSSGFGYLDVGADLTYPLPMMPAGYGDWEVSGGIHLLTLGDFLEAVNGGDGTQPLGFFGFNIAF